MLFRSLFEAPGEARADWDIVSDVARRMGYQNVSSLIGGYKGLVAAGWEIVR